MPWWNTGYCCLIIMYVHHLWSGVCVPVLSTSGTLEILKFRSTWSYIFGLYQKSIKPIFWISGYIDVSPNLYILLHPSTCTASGRAWCYCPQKFKDLWGTCKLYVECLWVTHKSAHSWVARESLTHELLTSETHKFLTCELLVSCLQLASCSLVSCSAWFWVYIEDWFSRVWSRVWSTQWTESRE